MGVCSIHYQIHVCIYILHLLMYILLHTIYMCVCVGKLYKVCIYSIYALQVYYTYVSKYVNTIYTIYILCVYIYILSQALMPSPLRIHLLAQETSFSWSSWRFRHPWRATRRRRRRDPWGALITPSSDCGAIEKMLMQCASYLKLVYYGILSINCI